eukprot:CAMPEP_0181306086 /NCGR_PEP_ID=MMETSP1101-20121128/10098_1 /TAXON_ID=46948 /ORGANISM="Rhodomonas abbreviata, Strain Caron Lab Isolate" /LENGTH=816 /DNA_ID=CAMNT_0023412091 /DNA_START=213 /DNA_END=2663 /DNA_ORIENTATION=-
MSWQMSNGASSSSESSSVFSSYGGIASSVRFSSGYGSGFYPPTSFKFSNDFSFSGSYLSVWPDEGWSTSSSVRFSSGYGSGFYPPTSFKFSNDFSFSGSFLSAWPDEGWGVGSGSGFSHNSEAGGYSLSGNRFRSSVSADYSFEQFGYSTHDDYYSSPFSAYENGGGWSSTGHQPVASGSGVGVGSNRIPPCEGEGGEDCVPIDAESDLKNALLADIIIGSNPSKLTGLPIFPHNLPLAERGMDSNEVGTNNLKNALITLVLKQNQAFSEKSSVTVEDMMTLHFMEPENCKNDVNGCAYDQIKRMLLEAPEDSDEGSGISINGAFRVTLNSIDNVASLTPTAALLERCPLNPTRPTISDAFPEVCVARREIASNGASSTAIELPALGGDTDECVTFVHRILDTTDDSETVGRGYSQLIASEYGLDGSGVNRAFWINPGYEWAPRELGDRVEFHLSQKVMLFVLVKIEDDALPARRQLLATTNDDLPSSMLIEQGIEFNVSPQKMMASAFRVPAASVGTFSLGLKLSPDEVCMSPEELRQHLRLKIADYVSEVASEHKTVQVTSVTVEKGGADCRRRLSRAVLATAESTADVQIMVVFAGDDEPTINLQDLMRVHPEVLDAQPLVANEIRLSDDYAPRQAATPTPPSVSGEEAAADKGSSSLWVPACAAAAAVVFLGVACTLYRAAHSPSKRCAGAQAPSVHAVNSQVLYDLRPTAPQPPQAPLVPPAGRGPVLRGAPAHATALPFCQPPLQPPAHPTPVFSRPDAGLYPAVPSLSPAGHPAPHVPSWPSAASAPGDATPQSALPPSAHTVGYIVGT